MPFHPLATVRLLAQDENKCEFFSPVMNELKNNGMDTDDLREIISSDLGETHHFKSVKTEKYYPETTSDYYSIWVVECNGKMFLKLLVTYDDSNNPLRLVVTSFKRDDRYNV